MAYPSTIDSFTTKENNVTDVLAAHINDLQTAIVALETKVGVDNSIVATTIEYKVAAKENYSNKVTSLSASSTDVQYPSAKLVYDQLAGKQASLTFGIANTNAVKIDAAGVELNDYAKFTANGLLGRSYSEVLSDIGAQASLGFTPENVANKSTSVSTDGSSDTKYPSVKAVKDYADGLVAGLLDYRGGYDASANTFPATGGSGTAGAVMKGDLWVISVAGALGSVAVQVGDSLVANVDAPGQTAGNWNILNGNISYVPEDVANKVASFQVTPDDTHYASEKLVKDSLDLKAPLTSPTFATSISGSYLTASEMLITDADKKIVSAPVAAYPSLTEISYIKGLTSAIQTQLNAKAPSANPTFTGTVVLPKAIEIQDTSADHQYVLAVNELTADRTVTLPLLTGNDEFTFNAHTQTLTNKRVNPRLVTATSYTTDTGTSLDVSTCDQFEITAQAGALKFNNPGGTPLGGQKLIIRIKDSGAARALTYDTQFRAIGVTLPTTTVISKTLYMGFIYNATDTKWDCIAVAQEA